MTTYECCCYNNVFLPPVMTIESIENGWCCLDSHSECDTFTMEMFRTANATVTPGSKNVDTNQDNIWDHSDIPTWWHMRICICPGYEVPCMTAPMVHETACDFSCTSEGC
jgi:hypothetical protein